MPAYVNREEPIVTPCFEPASMHGESARKRKSPSVASEARVGGELPVPAAPPLHVAKLTLCASARSWAVSPPRIEFPIVTGPVIPPILPSAARRARLRHVLN